MPTTETMATATYQAEADELYLPPPPWWDTTLHRRELWRGRIRPALAAVILARSKRERARALLEAEEAISEALAEDGGVDGWHAMLMFGHCSDRVGHVLSP